jgi:hypothetical protein
MQQTLQRSGQAAEGTGNLFRLQSAIENLKSKISSRV